MYECPDLPAGVGVSVVHEVVGDPVIDAGQRDLVLLRFLHRHADESGVGIRRLHVRVRLIVYFIMHISGHGR